MSKEIAAILAVGPKGIIGKGDKLVWHSTVDFGHFKNITSGNACLFGSVTYFGLPVHPLSNRLNIVLDNTQKEAMKINKEGYIAFKDIKKALEFCQNYDKVFFCGGKSIYEYVFKKNLINTLYLTKITSDELENEALNNLNEYVTLDIDFNKLDGWMCVESQSEIKEGDLKIKFLKYTRKN